VPQYFGNPLDSNLVDQIALGAMADWDLASPVKDGDFSSLIVPGASLDELMGAAPDAPSSRATLIDADAGIAAVGAMRDGSQTRLLLTTWVPYTRTDAAEVQKIVFESLKAERHRRGFQGGLGEVGMEDAVAAASNRLQGGEDPMPVLESLLQQTVDVMQRNFKGWSVITTEPDHIAWPEELLTPRMTYVSVAAGTRLQKGSPWATTAVLIVAFVDKGIVADEADVATAVVLPAR